MNAPSTSVEVYLDPGCPWTWVTTRWLLGVATRHDVEIRWRPFSLWLKNGMATPAQFRANSQTSLRALRVMVRIDETVDNEAAGRFYTERGKRLFTAGEPPALAEALAAAGLVQSLADSADDEGLDDTIKSSMARAWELAGDSAGSPVLAIGGAGHGFHGPVLSQVPDDETSDRLWAHVVGLAGIDELYELKRDRRGRPVVH